MLAFAHIPTGTAANQGFDIDEVNGRLIHPAVAPTAIGADIETGRVEAAPAVPRLGSSSNHVFPRCRFTVFFNMLNPFNPHIWYILQYSPHRNLTFVTITK
jgi:hypothetical protein